MLQNSKTYALLKRIAGIYLTGAIILTLAFLAVVSTIVQFSLGTVLGIWLGIVLGGFIVFSCAHYSVCPENKSIRITLAFSAAILVLVLIHGVTAGVLFTGPWYYMRLHGVGTNLMASGEGAMKFGTYHFNETAFVDTRFLGVMPVEFGKSMQFYCVAPIVQSLQQTRSIYWAVAYDCCNEKDQSQTCWPTSAVLSNSSLWNVSSVTSNPALLGTVGLERDGSLYLSKHVSEALNNTLIKFSNRIQIGVVPGIPVHPSIQMDNIDARVPLWVSLRSDNPEAYREERGSAGLTWMAVSVGLWPLVLIGTLLVFVILACVVSLQSGGKQSACCNYGAADFNLDDPDQDLCSDCGELPLCGYCKSSDDSSSKTQSIGLSTPVHDVNNKQNLTESLLH